MSKRGKQPGTTTTSSSSRRPKDDGSNEGDCLVVQSAESFDILMGRESLNAFHKGTFDLMRRIDDCLEEYTRSSRSKKTLIIQDLHRKAKENGRFLLRSPTGPGYVLLTDASAKEKISNIIRYRRTYLNPSSKSSRSGPRGVAMSALTSDTANSANSGHLIFRFPSAEHQVPDMPNSPPPTFDSTRQSQNMWGPLRTFNPARSFPVPFLAATIPSNPTLAACVFAERLPMLQQLPEWIQEENELIFSDEEWQSMLGNLLDSVSHDNLTDNEEDETALFNDEELRSVLGNLFD